MEQKPETIELNNPHVWDDTELIEAWDEAVQDYEVYRVVGGEARRRTTTMDAFSISPRSVRSSTWTRR
jgi:hypothetical protein